jgi:hypothetical protein
MERLLLIGGVKASGKAVIRGKLDGHSQIFVSPLHELVHEPFAKVTRTFKWPEDELEIWTLLMRQSKYVQLEKFSQKEVRKSFNLGSSLKIRPANFCFDFDQFEQKLKNRLANLEKFTAEDLVLTIYQQLAKSLESSPESADGEIYYGMLSTGYINTIKTFVEQYKNAKIIYVRRDVLEVMASMTARERSNPSHQNKNWIHKWRTFAIWTGFQFVYHTLKQQDEAEQIQKLYPNKVLNLNFHDLFGQPEKLNAILSSFLNIQDSQTLSTFTILGEELDSEGLLLSRSLDKSEEILNKLEIWICKLKILLTKIIIAVQKLAP